ncbi:MAG: HAD-IA family hydrolase [Saprospiraceae bacterium]|nr:HAD-IA family hydrolase [Saprospiraceae bacterium]
MSIIIFTTKQMDGINSTVHHMKPEKIQLVIWDCDGVLVDSEHLATKAFHNIILELGGTSTYDEVYHSLKGGSIYKAIDYVKAQAIVPESFLIEQEYRSRSFELFKQELKAVAGVESILQSLQVNQSVASNGPQIKILHNLEVTGLLKHFKREHIFSGHDIQKFKPDPDLFIHVATTLNYAPYQCLIIEDSEHGAHAAKLAGMQCFGYAAETNVESFLKYDAIPFYNMAELERHLEKLGLWEEVC